MGILGILVLILDLYAIYNVLLSGSPMLEKLLWSVGIIVLPVIGFVVWLLAGPRGGGKLLA